MTVQGNEDFASERIFGSCTPIKDLKEAEPLKKIVELTRTNLNEEYPLLALTREPKHFTLQYEPSRHRRLVRGYFQSKQK